MGLSAYELSDRASQRFPDQVNFVEFSGVNKKRYSVINILLNTSMFGIKCIDKMGQLIELHQSVQGDKVFVPDRCYLGRARMLGKSGFVFSISRWAAYEWVSQKCPMGQKIF